MFRAYALDLDQIGSLIEKEPVESIYDNVDREKINSSLKDILKANVAYLNGEELIELFFPSSKCCPVFLSHSGLDKGRVEQFAQWLKKNFEINSFIDSDLWGCITDLQWQIDSTKLVERNHQSTDQRIKQYVSIRCSAPSFDYTDRNDSTAHVHIMLCEALARMIDNAECFIFLGSSNSYSDQKGKKGTFSPWIFHELSTVDIIRENRNRTSMPDLHRLKCFSSHTFECDEGKKKIEVFYPLPLKRQALLTLKDLEQWVNENFDTNSCNDCKDYMSIGAVRQCEEVADGTQDAREKWEKALNWLYKYSHEKRKNYEISMSSLL